MEIKADDKIIKKLSEKSVMKAEVYENTLKVFNEVKKIGKALSEDTKKKMRDVSDKISVDYTDRGMYEAQLKFAGDTLILMMHTNIFEFPRHHPVMRTSYIKKDESRSYCGVINIFNFLSDSFKYNRGNDVGYLVARIFINRELHYLVEGKSEIILQYNNFINEKINKEAIKNILESAILYCIDFDLLTPPYDNVKEVSVQEFQERSNVMQLKTGKRLGFKFQADHKEARKSKEFKGGEIE